MNEKLFSLLCEVTNIEEFHVVGMDTNITDKISHLTICCFVQVGQDSVFELRVFVINIVVTNLLLNGNFEGRSVLEDILKFRFINRHAFLVSIVELSAVQSVPVL